MRGEENYNSLLDAEKAAKKKVGGSTTRIEEMGQAAFDRMVSRLKEIGWSDKYSAGKDYTKYTPNDWGNNIFDLTRDIQNRHFDMMLRRQHYQVFMKPEVMDSELARDKSGMSTEQVYNELIASPDVPLFVKEDVKLAKAQHDDAQKVPYIPTYRTGEYFVALKQHAEEDANPKTVAMMRFDTPIEAEHYAKLLRADKELKDRNLLVSHGQIREEFDSINDDSRGLLRMANRVAETVGNDYEKYGMDAKQARALKDAVLQDAYRLLPENNYLKSRIHRQGIVGWRADEQFSGLMKFVARENHSFARMRHDVDIQRAFEDMTQNIKELSNPDVYPEAAKKDALDPITAQMIATEMRRRYLEGMEYLDNPLINNVQRIRSFTTSYQLGMSPGYLIANLTQPYIMTLPVLGARYGYSASAKAMLSSLSMAGRVVKEMMARGLDNTTLSSDFVDHLRTLPEFKTPENAARLDVIEHMLGSGKIDFGTLTHTATELAEGDSQRSVKFTRIISAPAQYTEVLNRLTTGLAAYALEAERLGKGKPAGSLKPEALAPARDRALWAIDETQFNYARVKQGRLLQYHGLLGPLTPLFTTFLNFSLFSMELMARNVRKAVDKNLTGDERAIAKKTLGGMMLTTMSLAGAAGLPFASPLMGAAQLFADDDTDVHQSIRSYFNEVFGKDIALGLDQGLPAMLGFNANPRVGMQDMLPYSRLFTGYRSIEDQKAMDFLGNMSPSFGTFYSIVNALPNAYSWIVDGDNSAASATIRGLPAALRGAATAASGYYDPAGVPLPGNDSFGAKLSQTLGFTPTQRTEQMMQLMATKNIQARLQNKAAAIRTHFNAAFLEHDQEDMAFWREKAVQFAKENPQMGSLVRGLSQGAMKLAKNAAYYKSTGEIFRPASKAWLQYDQVNRDLYRLPVSEDDE